MNSIYTGLPSWVIESAGLPGSPFCDDGGLPEGLHRSLTQSEHFHQKLHKVKNIVRCKPVSIPFSEILARIPNDQPEFKKDVSGFLNSGAGSLTSLLLFANFLFENKKNEEALCIVDVFIMCLEARRITAVA